MRKLLFIVALVALTLNACGHKASPQPIVNAAPPAIVEISHFLTGNTLKIEMKLNGGSHGIGYQIDRAEIDPYCNCPGFWRRFDEALPKPENFDKSVLTQLIVLKSATAEYAFRVRAIDALGRFSQWSTPFRVKAEVLK